MAEDFSATSRAGSRGSRAGADVLVVDDEELVRTVLKGTLSCWGHSVDVAAHGLEALRCLSQRAYDVILTDIQMPLLDGISLWRRAVEAGHPGAWILMTGSALPQLERPIPILRKPFELFELRETVRRAVCGQTGLAPC